VALEGILSKIYGKWLEDVSSWFIESNI
jgi:hypothetical protein